MAGVPAPRKISNFPFTETLTANQTFLVADPSGVNYQVTAQTVFEYVYLNLPPREVLYSNSVFLATEEITANVTVDQTYNGLTLYYQGESNVTITFANSSLDGWSLSVINFGNSNASINVDYNGFDTISALATLGAGKMTFTKVANTIIGK
jgi:hypothetical protein